MLMDRRVVWGLLGAAVMALLLASLVTSPF